MNIPVLDIMTSPDSQHALLSEAGTPIAQVYGVDLEEALRIARIFAAAPRMVDLLLMLQQLETLPDIAARSIDTTLELALGEQRLPANGQPSSFN